MTEPAVLVEVTRGERVESRHRGHAVVVGDTGAVVAAWGDPRAVIYPRSAAKMLQALPLVESGAAAAAGLGEELLALACASHVGAEVHTTRVAAWLGDLGLTAADLLCGPQTPGDAEARELLRVQGRRPGQIHNNCSGKHAGFLTLARHMGAPTAGYVEADHPVQQTVRAAIEEMCGEASPGWGIDGCSAPNFAVSLEGFARAMARRAAPERLAPARRDAALALVAAMTAHPVLVAGEGTCSTGLMRAARGRAAVKSGAEGVYAAILPEQRLGIALKIEDGAGRASEAAIAALLARCGVLERDHPAVRAFADAPVLNRREIETGRVRAVEALF
jgi:L-asparaginase II